LCKKKKEKRTKKKKKKTNKKNKEHGRHRWNVVETPLGWLRIQAVYLTRLQGGNFWMTAWRATANVYMCMCPSTTDRDRNLYPTDGSFKIRLSLSTHTFWHFLIRRIKIIIIIKFNNGRITSNLNKLCETIYMKFGCSKKCWIAPTTYLDMWLPCKLSLACGHLIVVHQFFSAT